jgi:ribonuclease HI
MVGIYTDGACTNNGKVGARASWAYYYPDNKSLSNSGRVPDEDPQTNQRGELMAINEAVKSAELNYNPQETSLTIFTDSTYSKNCLTIWISNWIKNKWKTSQGGDVSHRDIIEDTVNRLSRFMSFTITYVKAHTGENDNNSIVDKMATQVLEGKEKVVTSNKEVAIEGLPLQLMGPPIYEQDLVRWCLENIELLDKKSLESALLSSLTKTLKKKGYIIEKQRLHRTTLYRLKTDTLIKEVVINKQ